MQAFLEVWKTYVLPTLSAHCFAFGFPNSARGSIFVSFICVGLELGCVSGNRFGVASTRCSSFTNLYLFFCYSWFECFLRNAGAVKSNLRFIVANFKYYHPHQIPGQKVYLHLTMTYESFLFCPVSPDAATSRFNTNSLFSEYSSGLFILPARAQTTDSCPCGTRNLPRSSVTPSAAVWLSASFCQILEPFYNFSWTQLCSFKPYCPLPSWMICYTRFSGCILIHATRNGNLTRILTETVICTYSKRKQKQTDPKRCQLIFLIIV